MNKPGREHQHKYDRCKRNCGEFFITFNTCLLPPVCKKRIYCRCGKRKAEIKQQKGKPGRKRISDKERLDFLEKIKAKVFMGLKDIRLYTIDGPTETIRRAIDVEIRRQKGKP